MIKELDKEVDKTQNKMNFVQKKLGELLRTNGNNARIVNIICTRLESTLYNHDFVRRVGCSDFLDNIYMKINNL